MVNNFYFYKKMFLASWGAIESECVTEWLTESLLEPTLLKCTFRIRGGQKQKEKKKKWKDEKKWRETIAKDALPVAMF